LVIREKEKRESRSKVNDFESLRTLRRCLFLLLFLSARTSIKILLKHWEFCLLLNVYTFKVIKEIVARRLGNFLMKVLRYSVKISLDDLYFFIG
jgi:hypothetical protein